MKSTSVLFGATLLAALASAAAAQEQMPEETVFDGDYLSIGIGGALSPSYTGSDDYVLSVLPIVQGSLGGVGISPRAGGVALNFIPGSGSGPDLILGVAARLRSDRASQISDPVVKSLGKLDRAIEFGPSAGVSISQVLNPYDGLTASTEVMWDVAGAHGGMVVVPTLSYFTPISRALAASLSLSAEYADSTFMDYYFAVSPAQSAATGGELPAFTPDGGGFTKAGATLLLGYDLDGNLANGGWGLVGIAGYSRVLGDARRSPFTSVRGTPNQFLAVLGVGYTF